MAIDSYTTGFILITGTAVVACLGLLAVRKFTDVEKLKKCHDVGGQFLSVVGTMYAVLLGLVVVDAMNRFQQASITTENEANSLADIFLLADKFPDSHRLGIQKLCQTYANQVIVDEWPAMDDAKVFLPARKSAINLMHKVMDYEPKTEAEKAIYPLIVQESCQLWDCRRARTNSATNGMPWIEWLVLIVGGVVTVVFTYFFAIDYLKAQIAMTAMVALIIALNLFLVLLFGYPFSGDLEVHPDAFKVDLLIFNDQLGAKGSTHPPI